MDHSLPDTLAQTVHITRAAGDVIMRFYRSSFDVRDKMPDNPVTDADFAADNLLKERLLALLPQAGWLSEETVDNPERLDKELVWVVDPLDGTKEFVMGIPEFSVSVALVQNGEPLLGVIFNPASGELYTAARGQGLRFNDGAGSVSDRTSLQGAVVDASRSEWKRGEFDPFKEMVTVNVMGSIAYKLARVAAGQADATWSRGPKNEWDICAGALLVQEAGGRCVDLNGDLFTFNRPAGPKVNGIIADNGHLHEEIITTLAPHGAARLK
ncbi:MAG: 3'(2'),5'-bisphosphate nucleotidase CysQ [Chloroflexota bacterium]